ncbi:MAG TPA: Hsp20/alpha crystallin family protein [Acetobacteraceae bacterium]|jgi:HSP20 family molecular chaperone IbpA|nr:Hsp20/alpha crystallin family protein [Acetobacteraceae bacterium]
MPRDITEKMWADAVAMLDRAERIHRDFFHPAPAGWEPPVDLLETAGELIIIAALPGVRPSDVDLMIGSGEIAIVGTRRLPSLPRPARVHRMELPHGRFERRVGLPPGTYELTRRDLDQGCLTIVLRKVG